jgi:hypothetical protein
VPTATLVRGVLQVTGTPGDDFITITQTGAQSFDVSFVPAPAPTPSPKLLSGDPLHFDGVTAIKVSTGLGNDYVEIFGGERLEKALAMAAAPPPSSALKSLTITGDRSASGDSERGAAPALRRAPTNNDTVLVHALQVSGAVRVDLGNGDNSFLLDRGSFLGGPLNYTGGTDGDQVVLTQSAMSAVNLQLGDGDNEVRVGAVPFQREALYRQAAGAEAFLASLSIGGGAGRDDIWVQNAVVTGAIQAQLTPLKGSDTGNYFGITDSTVASVSVRSGAGDDWVAVGGSSTILGDAQFQLGDGNNRITLGADPRRYYAAAAMAPAMVELNPGFLIFGGALDVTCGAGQDECAISAQLVGGAATVHLGAGDDTLLLFGGVYQAKAQFFGGLGQDGISVSRAVFLKGSNVQEFEGSPMEKSPVL